MIDPALYSLLTANAPLTALIGTRVYPVGLPQEKPLPGIAYNAYDLRPLACRGGSATQQGVLELIVLASSYASLSAVMEALKSYLNRFDGRAGGYHFKLSTGRDTPGEDVPELATGFVKRLEYTLMATPVSA